MSKRSILSAILSLIVLTAFAGVQSVNAKDAAGTAKTKTGMKKKKVKKGKKSKKAKSKKKAAPKKETVKEEASAPDSE